MSKIENLRRRNNKNHRDL